MSILNDQRGQRSDELSFRADRALAEGNEDRAQELYGEAAELETELAGDVPEDQQRLKSTLAVSAAALWMRSQDYERAKKEIYRFLSSPESLTRSGHDELEELLDQVRIEQMVAESENDPANIVPLNVRLDGGRVRRGLAPTKAVKQREGTLTSQLTRLVEWKLGRTYRKAGGAAANITSQFDVYSAPAGASSYGIRLFVMPGSQFDLEGLICTPAEIVESYLELAAAAREGIPGLREHVEEPAYLRSFATGFRDLAPKGDAVETVTYGSPSWRNELPSYDFHPHHRQSLTQALGNLNDISPPDSVEGYLKGMDLTTRRPWIKIEITDEEADVPEKLYLDEDLSTDELGDKLHRRVRVPLEPRQVRRSTHPFALDVELIE